MGSPMMEIAKAHFAAEEWPFEEAPGRPVLRLGFEGEAGRWVCYAQAKDDVQQFLFYSVAPSPVPEELRGAVAEYLTRVNMHLSVGNFEMDFEDGEVRFRTSIDVEGDRLTAPLVRSLAVANVVTMDRYLPGLAAVVAGTGPAEALAAIDG
jgi:hypothetical protein